MQRPTQRRTAPRPKAWPLEVRYMPGPAQLAFHQARDEAPERGLLAGTGGGKTYAAGFEAFDITFRERGAVGIIAAPDFPQLEVSVYPTLERLLGLGKGERPRLADGGLEPYGQFNQSKKRIDWWNGWTWRFASMDTPQSVEGVPDAAFAWLNEARLVADFAGDDGPWNNLTRRLRGEDDRPRRAWFDTHSPTPGIVRAFKAASVRRVDVDGGSFEVARCTDPDRMTFQWSTDSAVKWRTISTESGRRIVGRYHGEAAKRILEGRYARQEGLVYSDFNEERNLKAKPPGLVPERLAAGIDWGWDITAIQLLAWTGSRKWSVAEACIEHASLQQIADVLHRMRRAYGQFTAWGGADRPDSASELCGFLDHGVGLDVQPVPPSRVMDGVGLLQTDLRSGEWLIDPGLKWLRQDLDNYVLDREKGEPDKGAYDAHSCIAAGSLVETRRGQVPIESVKPGDYAMTRQGWRRVTAAWLVERGAEVLRVDHDCGSLVGTGDHPVWVEGNGYTRLDALRYGDTLCRSPSPPTMEPGTPSTRKAATSPAAPNRATTFTAASGRTTTDLSRPATTSTTTTATRPTTTPQTSSSSPKKSTAPSTGRNSEPEPAARPTWCTSKPSGRSPPPGIPVQKDWNGIDVTGSPSWPGNTSSPPSARIAASPMVASGPSVSAATPARPPIVAGPESMTRHVLAKDAVPRSRSTGTPSRGTAADRAPRVIAIEPAGRADVYDLTVEDAHEFFADGILVKNCDAVRYAVTGERRNASSVGAW